MSIIKINDNNNECLYGLVSDDGEEIVSHLYFSSTGERVPVGFTRLNIIGEEYNQTNTEFVKDSNGDDINVMIVNSDSLNSLPIYFKNESLSSSMGDMIKLNCELTGEEGPPIVTVGPINPVTGRPGPPIVTVGPIDPVTGRPGTPIVTPRPNPNPELKKCYSSDNCQNNYMCSEAFNVCVPKKGIKEECKSYLDCKGVNSFCLKNTEGSKYCVDISESQAINFRCNKNGRCLPTGDDISSSNDIYKTLKQCRLSCGLKSDEDNVNTILSITTISLLSFSFLIFIFVIMFKDNLSNGTRTFFKSLGIMSLLIGSIILSVISYRVSDK